MHVTHTPECGCCFTPLTAPLKVDKQSNITVALKVYKRHKLEDFERTQVGTMVCL